MRAKTRQPEKTPLEWETDRLKANGYTVISPDHNAITTILAELGKADLSPREVEALCQTAKCASLNGFVRYDALPCGCGRVYRGLILGCEQTATTYNIKAGGIEGVKPCQKHTALVASIKLEEKL